MNCLACKHARKQHFSLGCITKGCRCQKLVTSWTQEFIEGVIDAVQGENES